MSSARPSPILLLLAAVIGVTVVMPAWISILQIDAGLWGTTIARWDDMHVDVDIFGVAYLAFAVSAVGVVLLARAGLSGMPAARHLAHKAMVATLVAMGAFLLRMLIETGVGLNWAGVIGPAATIAAIFALRHG